MSHSSDWGRLISRDSAYSELYEIMTTGSSVSSSGFSGPAAVKVIKLPVQLGEFEAEEKLSQVVREHTGLCQLKHRNLMRLLDMRSDPKVSAFLVYQEQIEGQNLEKRISVASALPETEIRLYSTQICSALAYLHENDVIHRNINGKSVMITRDNVVKLIDFGISIQLLDEASRYQTGCPTGEPQFMAPELCTSDESKPGGTFSRGSDIWAFGCVVFHMVTGKRPLADCRSMMAIVRRICNDEAPGLPDTCTDALRRFYAGCMVRDRRGRTSAADLLRHEFLTAPSP